MLSFWNSMPGNIRHLFTRFYSLADIIRQIQCVTKNIHSGLVMMTTCTCILQTLYPDDASHSAKRSHLFNLVVIHIRSRKSYLPIDTFFINNDTSALSFVLYKKTAGKHQNAHILCQSFINLLADSISLEWMPDKLKITSFDFCTDFPSFWEVLWKLYMSCFQFQIGCSFS